MKAFITGANGDIGYACVNDLLKNNYTVTALDKSCNKLSELAKQNKKLNVKEMDLLNLSNNDLNIFTEPYQVLIYAAGIREIKPAASLTAKEWHNILTVNLTAAFLITQHMVKLAIAHNKPLIIIYISSISGLQGEPQRSAYCASKHGLIGLAKSLALELAQYAIRVNVVAPGIIETDLTKPYQQNAKVMERLNHNIPLTRWGMPEHIVQTVDLIIKNDYLTGSTLVVDGGWTAGKIL